MERHHPYCATCRASLCVPCALSAAHRDHYLLSRAAPLPCASCADGASAQALQAAGLPETFSTAVTEALCQLQLLLLDCTRGGARISRHCDVMGALPLDLALGLLPQPQGAEPALPAVLRAVQRCPMLTCTRVSGANALVGLHHPRAHELLALAAPHAARLPQPLAGRAARALAERGLLPRALAALADSSRAPLWSPQACGPTPAAAAAASPLALLPPPRLACHSAAPGHSGPPPALQYLSAAAATAAAAAAAAAPASLALRTPLELRAWVRRIMEALLAAGSAPTAPGEVKGVCAILATQSGAAPGAGAGARARRLARLDLACSLPGIGSASLDLEAMSAACIAERVREEAAGGGGAAGRAGWAGRAEALQPPFPSALTLLHPLLPLLLHPALLKAVRSADTLAALGEEAGLHAVNTLCLDIVAGELQGCALGAGQEEWQALRSSAQAACAAAAGAGSSEAALQALQLNLHWLRLTALLPPQSAAQSSSAAPAPAPASASASASVPPPPCELSAAIHCAWLCSQLSGLAPPTPASASPALTLSRKRTLDTALASQHSAYPLTMPPWYLECMGCRAECAGHFIVDCPAWLLNA